MVGADVPLWSSTSNFPMTRLAAGMAHPERAIVVHPVQTQLIIFVEVVAGEQTSEETVATTMGFCDDVGLRAVRVRKEIPGFLWNRVWFAMLREMLHLVDIGAADPLELDSMVQTTLRAFVPVFGPLQMTDLIGHDTLRDISNALYPELADRSNRVDDDRTARRRRTARRQERAGLLRRQRPTSRRAHDQALSDRPSARRDQLTFRAS